MILFCSNCQKNFTSNEVSLESQSTSISCPFCGTQFSVQLTVQMVKLEATEIEPQHTSASNEQTYDFEEEDLEYYRTVCDNIKKSRNYFEFGENTQKSNRHNGTPSTVTDKSIPPLDIPQSNRGSESLFDNANIKSKIPYGMKGLQEAKEAQEAREALLAEEARKAREALLAEDIDEELYLEENRRFYVPERRIRLLNHAKEDDHKIPVNKKLNLPSKNIEIDDWIFDDLNLDEYDDELINDYIADVETDGRVDKKERAYQIAFETAAKFGWDDEEQINLLAKEFKENGWSLSRSYLIQEVKTGMTYEEFRLAVMIRNVWNSDGRFTAGLYKGKSTQSHFNIRWDFCHKLIECYASLPGIDEIEMYLHQLMEYWSYSPALRDNFYTFYSYLKFRTHSADIPFELTPDYPPPTYNYKKYSQEFALYEY
ncbi:hypothetical protein [Desulfoluna sp.]|uniref:hypothetical protein n=1 Tax=Desulfoluna sp. TaxID=2045199 RepID=UPI002602F276|nr:hypothetical protein [Desulfoluna sp.]